MISTATPGRARPVPAAKRHPYDQWAPDARALDVIGDKWTLLIARELLPGPVRFVSLQRQLPGISTEQLRIRLNQLVAAGLLTRKRYREVPPRVDYGLTDAGRDLQDALNATAVWGRTHAWGAPRDGEDVNVASLLLSAAPLMVAENIMPGLTRFRVDDQVIDLDVHEWARPVPVNGRAPDVELAGSADDWHAALMHGDHTRLTTDQDGLLVLAELDAALDLTARP